MAFGPFSGWDKTKPAGTTEVRQVDNVVGANNIDLQSFIQNLAPQFTGAVSFIGPSSTNAGVLDLGTTNAARRFRNLNLKGRANIPSAWITTLRSNSALITTIRALGKITGPLMSGKSSKFATARAGNGVITTLRLLTKATGPLFSGTNVRFLKATGGLASSKSAKFATARANKGIITTLLVGTKASGPLFSGTNVRFTTATGGTITAVVGRIGTLRVNTKATGPLFSGTNLRFNVATGKLVSSVNGKFPDTLRTNLLIATTIQGGLFGTWGTASQNSVYYATADCIVVAEGTGTNPDCSLLSDAANPPTILRARGGEFLVGGSWGNFTCPVRKGDYWKAAVAAGTWTVRKLRMGG